VRVLLPKKIRLWRMREGPEAERRGKEKAQTRRQGGGKSATAERERQSPNQMQRRREKKRHICADLEEGTVLL